MANEELNKILDAAIQSYRINNDTKQDEQYLLGAIIYNTQYYADISDIVKSEFMCDEHHANIYNAFEQLYDEGVLIQTISINERMLRNGTQRQDINTLEYLNLLLDEYSVFEGNILECARRIRDNYILYSIFQSSKRVINLIYNPGQLKISNIVDNVISSFDPVKEILLSSSSKELYLFKTTLSNEIARTLYGDSELLTYVPVNAGIAGIDNLLNGFKPGQLILIAARPSVGKTTFALQIAKHISFVLSRCVIFFSLEMGRAEIIRKIFLSETGIHINENNARSGDVFTKIQSFLRSVPTDKLFLSDIPSLTVPDIKRALEQIKLDSNTVPDLIIIDYLQLLSYERKGGYTRHDYNRQEEIGNISRDLKLLARQFNVPVIALSQLNRASVDRHDKTPQLHDLRGSGTLEQDADVVCMLHTVDNEEDEAQEQSLKFNITKCFIAKNRNGPIGFTQLYFYKNLGRFTENNI